MIHAIALAAAAFSANCPPDNEIATAKLYSVTPGDRLTFYRTPDCGDASCEERAFVVAGDRVVVSAQANGRSCAVFSRAVETTGWLDSRRLVPDVAADHPTTRDWVGRWSYFDDEIRLSLASNGRLHVEGDAYWPGKHPAENTANGPNVGSLDGTATAHGDRLDYADDDTPETCRATLRLLGPYLLVDDNGDCGGNNVRFCGTYLRHLAQRGRRPSTHRPATRS